MAMAKSYLQPHQAWYLSSQDLGSYYDSLGDNNFDGEKSK
ncbi:hypothetical protein FOXG_22533 [Fusarium oxysporum f. sp. lycopersici 4287]|uniref:Uncharacterized protein n=1 Tax=Fusarium oxysporum f. sp. lycopersici (strain 4287 / CBS 123668 / FGSC 9935 / NRRL 34936) TaxID=426428 RepID=A0A0J9W9R4_FUSO4|nr:hypothetical protein FOXG_22533 [Fusarium oxysporum f. sp. lycopersici 4287]KNB19340.1 hypothetical protein FOXG_22533 [Fusarium oxysporum f. sp. lycopersici 4287]